MIRRLLLCSTLLVLSLALQAATAEVRTKPFVVVIDAGHGGKDSGAIGPSGTQEKDIVLSIARRLRISSG